MRIAIWILGILASVGQIKSQDQALHRWRAEGAVVETILIPERDFSLSTVRNASNQWLKESESIRFGLIRFLGRAEYARLGGVILDRSYSTWLKDRTRIRNFECCFAELVKIGDSATLRFRGKGEQIERIVLRGKDDPLVLRLGDDVAEILFIQPLYPPERRALDVFVASKGAKSVSLAEGLTKLLSQNLQGWKVHLSLRTDIWFITATFPHWYPFKIVGSPPSREEWESSTVIGCSMSSPGSAYCVETRED